jgi:hypothetical protein
VFFTFVINQQSKRLLRQADYSPARAPRRPNLVAERGLEDFARAVHIARPTSHPQHLPPINTPLQQQHTRHSPSVTRHRAMPVRVRALQGPRPSAVCGLR